MYTLVRTTPSGVTKKHSPTAKLRDVATAAAYVLHDNTRTTKADAQRFAALLTRAPIGETLHHETGYSFRVERATA